MMNSAVHAETLSSTSTTWTEDSTISDDVTINSAVTVTGNITLTIPEGKTLTVNGGITATGYTLTVSGDGKLNVTGTNGSTGTDGGSGNAGSDGDIGGNGGSGGYNSSAVTGTIICATGAAAQESDNASSWSALSSSSSSKLNVRAIITVTLVSLDKTSITLIVDSKDTDTLTAAVTPDNATYKTVTWTTSDTSVAAVDQDGKVTAVGAGEATITATATNGTSDTTDDETAACTVTVLAHSHTFSSYKLSTDGTTITAVCTNSDGLCKLPDYTAALIISAPTTGGGAASLSGDLTAFGVSASDITYSQRSGDIWGDASSTVPTGTGFFRAHITVEGLTASVTYGVSAINVQSGIEHGTVTAPDVAAVGVVVPLTFTPETGYELDTLTPTKTSGGSAIDVTTATDGSKSFIMPDEEVTVGATFKLAD